MTKPLKMLLALGIGALGGTAFYLAHLPLPWMLGSLCLAMAAAIGGAPVAFPARIRAPTVAVIGVMIGSGFTPEVLALGRQWIASLGVLAAYVAVVAVVVVPFYRVFARTDWQTAYLAGLPGGLNEMVELGEEKGADVRVIILAHSLRIVVTIALIALWFRVIEGQAVGAMPPFDLAPISLQDALLLIGAAVVGMILGARLRLPAAAFLGPLILSAALHLGGVTTSAPPAPLVVVAQIVLGTGLGCRFVGVRAVVLVRAAVLAVASTVMSLVIAGFFVLVLRGLVGVPAGQGMLALAPGGVTEMGLISLAIGADVAFVALHHIVRILIVLVLARPLLALIAARFGD
ncbi:MAG: AbrB family transcriptional regulator [Gemmobacter sp.]